MVSWRGDVDQKHDQASSIKARKGANGSTFAVERIGGEGRLLEHDPESGVYGFEGESDHRFTIRSGGPRSRLGGSRQCLSTPLRPRCRPNPSQVRRLHLGVDSPCAPQAALHVVRLFDETAHEAFSAVVMVLDARTTNVSRATTRMPIPTHNQEWANPLSAATG